MSHFTITEPAKVNFSEEPGPMAATSVRYATLVLPRLALPGRILSDLSRARALAAAWTGMSTLAVLAEGTMVDLKLDAADVRAWHDTNPQLLRVYVGAVALPLLDAPPLPPGA